jgi:hypothetical protein
MSEFNGPHGEQSVAIQKHAATSIATSPFGLLVMTRECAYFLGITEKLQPARNPLESFKPSPKKLPNQAVTP